MWERNEAVKRTVAQVISAAHAAGRKISICGLPHRYEVHLAGGPAGYAHMSSAGLPELRTAPPGSKLEVRY